MTIKIHDLKPARGATRQRKRVGRGIAGKGGKTAGRGTKGQRARDTVPRGFEGEPTFTDLNLIASRTENEPSYHRVSQFLADTVLRDGEAVLARNVEDDSQLGARDSKGVIHSTSVICAPIRQDKNIVGLIHLYSTSRERLAKPVIAALHMLARRVKACPSGKQTYPTASSRQRGNGNWQHLAYLLSSFG